MKTDAPSQHDGKPVGTPTNIVPAWKAGVTFGPDQVERDAAERKARNRAAKLAAKARRQLQSPVERAAGINAHKQRRNRADRMTRALRNGTPIPNVAHYYGISADEVLTDVKWLSAFRNRHPSRRRVKKLHPILPERKLS